MTMTLISAADLATHLGAADVRVFDVRHDLTNHAAGREAYAAGHIPGARYLDHETELAAPRTGRNGRHPLPDRGQFGALMAAHGVTPETLVVAYDASGGMYAAHLWWMLRWLGHDRVAVLDGGWQAWQAAGLPTSTEAAAPVQAGAPVTPAAPLVGSVDAQAVLDNIARPGFTVIDARAANRYRGEVEPMDPVAGHIPGALNRPNGQNLQADGRFKDAAQLRQEFTALLDGRDPAAIVHQCGSGITACHNLLSMEIAGLAGSRLYPGSWSEWCSDPSRPVAKGE
ncbi:MULTISPECIES: sulfurtransferase [Achromobacter]|uniref:sulfurtransferase n=1 Tax=Achromobacter TaxID=222 RepID=UPI0006C4F8B7|nr:MULTISPECIES: sulfurtransferase [Achromobacter]OFL35164.1 3-mercaptopyruvate sulfurtransferase [Achromobacter xylosoxidans]OFU63796.1 3-mercaptopyruvate sulfurtransferase [Achromobacter xylosoxidans]PWY41387.1 sulfurtransferase [Achromobacter sp. RW408]QQE57161.1 sulfurtransferase [Achromobacter xylosoxidans]QQV16801.1 sulfurtransferase [Achromobacter xylosoxidans]